MTRIAVYAVMKNEERNVPGWLGSVVEADEVVVVDTGSTDRTVETLKRGGAFTPVMHLIPFDFALARNSALGLVSQDIDLCVWLDADERLEPGWREAIEADPYHESMRVLIDGRCCGWRTHPRTAVHRRHGYHWKYPVHEMLVGPPPTRRLEIGVTHYRTWRKPHNWVQALYEAVAEDPIDARLRFYLGRDLLFKGNRKEARVELEKSLALGNDSPVLRSETYRLLFILTRDRSRLLQAMAECPLRREPVVDLALDYLRDRDVSAARECLTAARTLTDEWLWTTETYAWDDPFDRLCEKVGV